MWDVTDGIARIDSKRLKWLAAIPYKFTIRGAKH